MLRSFDSWLRRGRQVNVGARHITRGRFGRPLFSFYQTHPTSYAIRPVIYARRCPTYYVPAGARVRFY